MVFNPELVGTLLRYTLRNLPDDYQDLAIWRRSVRFITGQLAGGEAHPVIVPMTITDERYFTEIVGGLRADGHQLAHVTLVARPDTIQERMRTRNDQTTWAAAQVDRCIATFDGRPLFREYVATDDQSVEVVAREVMKVIEGRPRST